MEERKELDVPIKDIEVRPEDVEIPPEVERATGAAPTQSQFTAKVTDDKGQQLISSPTTQTVAIKVPVASTQLDDWAKGPIENSLTWFANFWIRLIKKALFFGWKILGGGKGE